MAEVRTIKTSERGPTIGKNCHRKVMSSQCCRDGGHQLSKTDIIRTETWRARVILNPYALALVLCATN